jgi:hypothetical protein
MTLEPTSNDEKETHLRLTIRQKQLLQLRCLRLMAEGLSVMEIAEKEGLTIWHAKQVLNGINREAREGLLSTMISDRVPLSVEVSLETFRILKARCFSIMRSSKDDRVILQSVAQIASLQEKENEILNSANIIAGAIKKVLILHPPNEEAGEADA